jgi:hypothetical protein
MSYLDLPRIHFGGLFFTNPDTINNRISNYDPQVKLTNPDGSYLPRAGWNAVGVAQLWLAECSVLSVAGPSGTLVTDAAADPVIGAAVESPSPSTPKKTPDGKGSYDIAKMVDLDPAQQGRSAVYGLRIYVTLADGAGFSGLMSVPMLQELNGRMALQIGSWSAVGTWMGQITEVAWSGDLSSSPFLVQFQAACSQGIAVKLTVDLHQNSDASQMNPGNNFCYGRVHGALGPIGAGELAQVVPGRMIQVPPAVANAMAGAALESVERVAAPAPKIAPEKILGVTLDARFRKPAPAGVKLESAAAPSAAPAPPAPWNPAPAQVTSSKSGSLLHVDLGGSIWLNASQAANGVGVSDGTFVVDTGIAVGFQSAAGSFQALANGQVSFASQYQLLSSQNKQVNLIRSAGLVDIALVGNEASLVSGSPLLVQVNGTTVLQEPADGALYAMEPFYMRFEPGTTGAVQLMARSFGQPIVGQEPLTWQIVDSSGDPSTEISISWDGPTDADGIASLTVSTPAGDVTLPPLREPLDSQLYLVFFADPSGQPVGDGYGLGQDANASLTVLRFQSYTAPAQPTWQADVGPILQAYARLYPGMKDKLDIGDEKTVQSAAPYVYARMALPLADPAYMPVTRDLSPTKIQTILQWLKAYLPPASTVLLKEPSGAGKLTGGTSAPIVIPWL